MANTTTKKEEQKRPVSLIERKLLPSQLYGKHITILDENVQFEPIQNQIWRCAFVDMVYQQQLLPIIGIKFELFEKPKVHKDTTNAPSQNKGKYPKLVIARIDMEGPC
jgi:hypothetical protein